MANAEQVYVLVIGRESSSCEATGSAVPTIQLVSADTAVHFEAYLRQDENLLELRGREAT